MVVLACDRLKRLLTQGVLRITDACLEDLDYELRRNLDRNIVTRLAA